MISTTILTKNSAKTLKKTLDSLTLFPEIILYDTGSTDTTLDIASSYPNVKIIQGNFLGFGKTHNLASQKATYDWILSIDSDEELSSSLAQEILNLSLDPQTVYFLQRHNYFNGKWIRFCGGWHPDWVCRLYHRQKTQFTEDHVHEKVCSLHMKSEKLKSPLLHTPYQEISDFLFKMQLYSSLFAEAKQGQQHASFSKALLHSFFAFIKSYFLKLGILAGKEGLIISLYNSHTTFYKYLKLYEKTKN